MNNWPYFSEDEISAATKVLQSGKVNYWTGKECKKFETEFAQYIGSQHAISLMNGTVSLELALRACGIKSGDEVITTPRTFIASASSIIALGAIPVFADIDLISQNITAHSIQQKITSKTKAIIPVHLAGYPCEMDKIMALAEQYQLYVIEDCAQAHGAEYKNKKVGNWGHFGSFSFCQDKIMTTGGEGGILVCNDLELYHKAWGYKDHGKDYIAVFNSTTESKTSNKFKWLHYSFGSNFRMTEMQAAIGRKQLKKLPLWLKKRNAIAQTYSDSFKNLSLISIPFLNENIYHAFYKYYLTLNKNKLKKDWDQLRIIREINEKGTPCFSGSCSEIYRENTKRQTNKNHFSLSCLKKSNRQQRPHG